MASFMKNIGIIFRCGVKYRNDKLNPYGINGCTNMFIINVVRNPGINQDKLVEMLCVNKSNVTRTLQQLEKEEFIERRVSENDKRSYELYPTQKAIDIFPSVRKHLASWNHYLLDDISEDEKKIFLDVLEKVTQKAKAYNDDACVLGDYNEESY